MGRATSGITAPMRSAAIMAAGGASAETIAAQLAAPYAQKVLIRQLDDGNPWVAQSAAREVLRQAQLAAGTAAATVTVQLGAMPAPGLPSGAQDDGI